MFSISSAFLLSSIVGEPVTVPQIKDPSPETVDRYHNMYICSLLKLFHEHKMKYGLGENAELRILWQAPEWWNERISESLLNMNYNGRFLTSLHALHTCLAFFNMWAYQRNGHNTKRERLTNVQKCSKCNYVQDLGIHDMFKYMTWLYMYSEYAYSVYYRQTDQCIHGMRC